MLSTTGGKLKVLPRKILENYKKIKKIDSKKNIVIGFGITKKTIKSLKAADGLVVGSMLCKTITNSLKMRQNPVTKLDKVVYNRLYTTLSNFVTGFCLILSELVIVLHNILPTTNPSAAFRDLIVFLVIPNPITMFFFESIFFIFL